jgi:hypothetical protein
MACNPDYVAFGYKAQSRDKSAQHDKALSLGDTVNAAVVQCEFTLLWGGLSAM